MNRVRSYRAFSLLPVIFKVFEMLLPDGLSDVLESGAFPCSQTGWWFSPVTSINKTDSHDITEILPKVALNIIIHKP
jgi:hypothetical protein